MPYSELVKDFELIREYMREFYINGFKSREEIGIKSPRTYDNERRRIESWLKDYMGFRDFQKERNVFVSIDCREVRHNPLYRAWKTKRFNDNDITLHFLLFDIFYDSGIELSIGEIQNGLASYFDNSYDYKTIQKKMEEYVKEGLFKKQSEGNRYLYSRSIDIKIPETDILDYFSEIAPCGVIGSFLLDKTDAHESLFTYKHHYIASALDSEVMCNVFMAMREKCMVFVRIRNRSKKKYTFHKVVPLRVYISSQTGRQYLMAYSPQNNKMESFRMDSVVSVDLSEKSDQYDELRIRLNEIQKKMWGVSSQILPVTKTQHVEFSVYVGDDEQHIVRRLEREKRIGNVERISKNEYRFTAEVFDSSELIPWIRSFICRITNVRFSNEKVQKHFLSDLNAMFEMYGIQDGD